MQTRRSVILQVTPRVEFAMPRLQQHCLHLCWPWSPCRGLEVFLQVHSAAVPSKWVRWAKTSCFISVRQPNPFVLEGFKWEWVSCSTCHRGHPSHRSVVTFPSLQGDLYPQPKACEYVRSLMGAVTFHNVAKLYRLWASSFISVREP